MDEHLKITYSSSVERLCEVNSSFDSGILKVAYVGRNRNGSSISKEAFENSMSTIYNCPIVCNYNRERDEIGSHDVEVVMDDGVAKIVNITQPVGVIPESAKYWWEKIEDASGMHEYLCIEAIIWKRQEAYEKIKENMITDESMEIRVKSGRMEDGIYVIDSFEFLAFCLLETAEPCYESASLEMFSMDEFRTKYAEMMEEFKQNFHMVNTSIEVDIHPQKNLMEGGEEHLEHKMELLAKFGFSADQLDFDIESMTYEELETELEKRKAFADNNTGADAGEGGDNAEGGDEGSGEDHDDNQFALSGEQFREGLIDALCAERITTEWGDMCRYMYCDYDSDAGEVFCYDVEDWKLYGFPFSMNGDNVVIDFKCKKRKKFSIVDFDEGDTEVSYKAMFDAVIDASVSSKTSELSNQFNAEKAELEGKYNAASDKIEELNIELNELRHYKQQKLSDERSAAEDAVFSMFTDLNGIEAFEDLRANCSELSIEELEDKCFAIRGRNATTHVFSSNKGKAPRLPIEKNKIADEPYGGLFVEFPPNR